MPFTISHPAMVILLKKLWPKYFSLTGLMAGAMAPDLIYFLIATTVPRGISHSWLGLFVFCLPASILFSFTFHWLFKREFINYLPFGLDNYLSGLAVSRWSPKNVTGWIIFIGSIIIGTLSHFFWDAFTHAQGELAQLFPFLNNSVEIFGRKIQTTKLLQHTSTIVGAVVIILFLTKGKLIPGSISNPDHKTIIQKILFWFYCVIFTGLFVLFVIWFYDSIYPEFRMRLFTTMGLASWAGMFWAVVLFSIFKKITGNKKVE